MNWYIENPRRFRSEREQLDDLAESADWLTPLGWTFDTSLRLMWNADVRVGERVFPLSLQFANHFPYSPPLVMPRGDTTQWSSHQYGPGGELCTEIGPDNWRPEIHGAELVRSAERLLRGEQAPDASVAGVPSRHATTLGQELRAQWHRFVVTQELLAQLRTLPERLILSATVTSIYSDETYVQLLTSIDLPDGSKWSEPSVPKILISESYSQPATVVRWPAAVALPPSRQADEFKTYASANGVEIPQHTYIAMNSATGLHVYRLNTELNRVAPIPIIPLPAEPARLAEAYAGLQQRKLGIAGCGSLGSKLAVSLARSGVGQFLLVDDDLLLPGNLVRHDLDWRDVGAHKADAVARRIQLVNANAVCVQRRVKLGGQESGGSIETLITALSECDLIIDATANARVFNYLSAASAAGSKPLIWAEVFGGGIGGLVARHRPGLEPEPPLMRETIAAWCRERGVAPPKSAAGYDAQGEGPPLIADDADVSVMAAHAARLAIDTLIPRMPSGFPCAVYIIGLAEGWIFSQPFETYPIDVGSPQATVIEPPDPMLVAEERNVVIEILKRSFDAAGPDSETAETS